MSKLSKMIYFLLSSVFFTFVCQYCSNLVYEYGYKLPENDFLDFVVVQNQGAAFNILQGSKLFLIIFAILAVFLIIFYALKHINSISGIGLFFTSMLCSGIISNMYERIMFGYVCDYIKLNFVDFPVFNMADIFINLSVFVIVIIIIKNNYTKHNETDN